MVLNWPIALLMLGRYGSDSHVPGRRTISIAKSRPKPRWRARMIQVIASGSKRRAHFSGPSSIGSKPMSAARPAAILIRRRVVAGVEHGDAMRAVSRVGHVFRAVGVEDFHDAPAAPSWRSLRPPKCRGPSSTR